MAIWVACFVGLTVLWYSYDLPDISRLQATTRRPSVTVLAQDGTVIGTYGDLYEDMIRISELPPYDAQALLAIEDRRLQPLWRRYRVNPSRLYHHRADRVVQGINDHATAGCTF